MWLKPISWIFTWIKDIFNVILILFSLKIFSTYSWNIGNEILNSMIFSERVFNNNYPIDIIDWFSL